MLESAKRLLKCMAWARVVNARLKADALRREYSATVAWYARKDTIAPFHAQLEQRLGARRARVADVARSPRLFFLGTDELQDRSGILQALSRLSELTYFTRSDGSYGQNSPVSEEQRRRTNTQRLLAHFVDLHQQGKTPDLLIAQTWADYVDPAAFSRIRSEYGTIVINISMDDRHQYRGRRVRGEWRGTRGLIPHIDLALTAAPECVDWYLKEGCPAMYFPEASDPEIFRPMPALPKTHDITFVGARYGIRERIVSALRRAGIRVTAFGNGWEHGRIGTEEVPRLFAQSRIVLGVSAIGHCDDFVALKLRDFDGPMSGTCYFTQANPDLGAHYEIGKEIVTYRDVDECVNIARHLLAYENERESIARAGRLRAVREHTWDKRFATVLNVLHATAARKSQAG